MPSVSPAGVQDQAANATRSDVLDYVSEPLVEAVEIAGEVKLDVMFASSVADTDLAAVLVDIDEEGHRWLVADGFLRIRHRNGLDANDPLTPGEPTALTVDLWSVSWTFAPGHRIGLHVSSASFPRFDRNLNTGRAVGEGDLADAVVATQTLLHGDSVLVLPSVE